MAEKRTFKLGRTARAFDPRIPHMSALLPGRKLVPLPATLDYTKGMPKDLGMMLNDTLGDCTCAAVYHAIQVWTFNASKGKSMETEPDDEVRNLYELACGYNPKVPGEGPGGNEQHVLKYLLRKGAPLSVGTTNKIAAFVEVDPRNQDDVKRTIYDCGVAYIGFNVPANIMPPGAEPPAIWTVDKSNPKIIGGHAVVLAGYDAKGARVISWGQYYTMTWDFLATYVDEVYAIADQDWVDATGKTPLGMSIADLELQMKALTDALAAAA